jgi:hypothetical protein
MVSDRRLARVQSYNNLIIVPSDSWVLLFSPANCFFFFSQLFLIHSTHSMQTLCICVCVYIYLYIHNVCMYTVVPLFPYFAFYGFSYWHSTHSYITWKTPQITIHVSNCTLLWAEWRNLSLAPFHPRHDSSSLSRVPMLYMLPTC